MERKSQWRSMAKDKELEDLAENEMGQSEEEKGIEH